MTQATIGKTSDGREFPQFEGHLLSWSLGFTISDEQEGFPRLRTVIRAMREYRPEQLKHEHAEILKASFDRIFGHNVEKVLRVIEEELQ